jgi:hypothetical protein
MQDVQLGKIISILDMDRIDKLAKDLGKAMGAVAVRYYKADLPVSLLMHGPTNPKKCKREKANYVQIFWRNRKVLEFYGKDIRGNGHVFEENLGRKTHEVLEILARNNMYTFRLWKERNIVLRSLMILFGTMDAFFGFLVSPINFFLGAICALFGVFLIVLYTK